MSAHVQVYGRRDEETIHALRRPASEKRYDSRGKTDRLHRTPAGFTTRPLMAVHFPHDLVPLIWPRQQVPKFFPNIDHLRTSLSPPDSFRHKTKAGKIAAPQQEAPSLSCLYLLWQVGYSYCNAKGRSPPQ